MSEQEKLLADFQSSLKVKLFFWKSLPSLLFWKVKVEKITMKKVVVSVPYIRKTKNPFNSTYFAALAGAAELSTGLIPFVCTAGKKVSMLVTGFEASFHKKATSLTYFTCNQGEEIAATIQKAIDSKEPQELHILSEGRNKNGDLIMKATVKWSFKAK